MSHGEDRRKDREIWAKILTDNKISAEIREELNLATDGEVAVLQEERNSSRKSFGGSCSSCLESAMVAAP
ncbi:unnamed protein product [Arabis nemorensis]|uniref:Uncharacterized protein n=1 Tax=Arabis nemorensis TaxID=586526 RepID=A0A565CL81_9BRAS|nr:unnamed protein product [Arabis nemorensis]